MRLTLYSDYSLRVLLYLGACHPRLGSITRISEAYGISRHHLVKVVNQLGHLGFVETLRGRGGGLRLARAPEKISLGEVVRKTEAMELVECFNPVRNTCPIVPACTLKSILGDAAEAFLTTLDRHTIADLLDRRRRLRQLLS